jgi:hypothetical protein
LCLRFVDRSTGQVEVREEFVGFLHAKSTRGQALATLLMHVYRLGKTLSDMRLNPLVFSGHIGCPIISLGS